MTTLSTNYASTWVDTDIAAGADIATSKTRHRYKVGTDFDQDVATLPAVKHVMLFEARADGELKFVRAGLWDSGTSTNIDFDLLVNNSSVLSADINVVHGTGDRTSVAGTISSATLAAGDWVSAKVKTVTSSTGALGPFMEITYDEKPE